MSSRIGLVGLAVMGQNLALNIAEKGFDISVWNRSYDKVVATEERAKKESLNNLKGFREIEDFVKSLQRPRAVIILIQAGKPVDEAIAKLSSLLEAGDIIIDGGNEWYANTERRGNELKSKGIHYVGMGVSGGEEGARNGPSLMPGGPREAYDYLYPILSKISAQVENDGPCVTYIGPGGAGNYVKMIHNGIEYGDMQLIAEAYDLLRNVGGLTNEELAQTFTEWNASELQSFLIEITATIFRVRDEFHPDKHAVDYILDQTGSKGTGRMTVQEAAELNVAAPTITAALDARYLSSLKGERTFASRLLQGPTPHFPEGAEVLSAENKRAFIEDVRKALYAAKICSYAQGMNILRAASKAHSWNLPYAEIARIWKGGCIIRAVFLDAIKQAYLTAAASASASGSEEQKETTLNNLLLDDGFLEAVRTRESSLRRVVGRAVASGIGVPSFSASLWYYDTYRRERTAANLTQAQRDFFGAHTYARTDRSGVFHTEWAHKASSL